MKVIAREDRILGCLLGGALGDAIGSYFEQKQPPLEFCIPPELRITDDTQLTIATCESIIECKSVDPASIANRFVGWFRDRRLRGLGASTLKSLIELDAGGHWALVGATGERSAGNGAAMRVAPLAFVLDPDNPVDRQTFRDICRITHRNEEAYIGALAMFRAIRHVAAGHPCDDRLLDVLIDAIPDSCVRDRFVETRRWSPSIREYADRYTASGFVVDSVPLAILAAIRSNDCVETIQQVVECGGDTDTIASMYGNIHGAMCGTSSLPMEIIDEIESVSVVVEVARQFSQTAIVR